MISDSLSEMAFMLWPEGNTILSLQQEISQILVDDKACYFSREEIIYLMLALHIARFEMKMWKVL